MKHTTRTIFHLFIYLLVYLFYLPAGRQVGLFSAVYAQACDTTRLNEIPLDEVNARITKCQEAWSQMEVAKKPHVDALRKMESDIEAFQTRIKILEADLAKKAAAIAEGEKALGGLLDLAMRRARQLYIRTNSNNPLVTFLGSGDIGAALRGLTYQMVVLNEDKKAITQTAISVKDLENRKKTLELERGSLAYLKEETDKRAASVRKLVGEASAYQSKLTSIIGSLTAKQQSFLAQKLTGLNLPTSLGAGPLYCTDDRKLDPGFRPAFAFFTFGIPHRVGMNQYGALGRAQAGQGYQDILRAYFDNISFEPKDPNMKIKVQGYGEKTLEEYALRIYEMPESWPVEALKAQAVAARSYAYAYTNGGAGEICTTQACQVFKPDPKGGNWEKAVKETEGQVMVSGGEVVKAWYSSTDGGYTFTSGDVWGSNRSYTKRLRDTNGDVGSFSDLMSKAYDRDSPCFYAAQGWRGEYGKSAWLKEEEVADIVNVMLLASRDEGVTEHLYQPDKSNPAGTDSWSKEKVRQELSSRGISPFTSISDIRASGVDWGAGRVTQMTASGNAGTVTLDGPKFKDYFNLRAPANIQIVGPLFNVERK